MDNQPLNDQLTISLVNNEQSCQSQIELFSVDKTEAISCYQQQLIDKIELTNLLSEEQKRLCLLWTLRLFQFHPTCKPEKINSKILECFLSHLAHDQGMSLPQQRIAEKTIRFCFKNFLKVEFGNLHFARRTPRREFFSRISSKETSEVIKLMKGTTQLIVKLAYESELLLQEVVNLRIGDLDLKKGLITVRESNGKATRVVPLPLHLSMDLRIQSLRVRSLLRRQYESDYKESSVDSSSTESKRTPDHEHISNAHNLLSQEKLKADSCWQFLFTIGSITRAGNRNIIDPLSRISTEVVKNDFSLAHRQLKRFSSSPEKRPIDMNLKTNRLTTHKPKVDQIVNKPKSTVAQLAKSVKQPLKSNNYSLAI
ncbi:tyrosine-type recombinase/integrase [Aliikangiella sp. G2MR2-5]|uniref:tyrosine-type recombinase/integrase n=1 Tax=Aliikangiella sp. G2MR2-5 TaxID=2788943 RepID=UPI0018ABD536|nr:tyrosine-type recombinase/integrase [Aliikangiella sp. G2MR2-5]